MTRSIYIIISLILSSNLISQKQITLEDIWVKGTYSPKSIPGFRFLNDGIHYSRLEKNIIKKYNISNGEFVSDIFDGNAYKDKDGFGGKISDYAFNETENKILIHSESESVYRHSTKDICHVFDIEKKSWQNIYPTDKISNALFSPDGQKVAFVFQNNLYSKNIITNELTQITTDGAKNEILNGLCDWVYEEEFSFTRAFSWSKDSKKIAFIRFDESLVPEFTMEWYRDEMYPVKETFKYPKVGEKNAEVSTHVYDFNKKETKMVDIGIMTDMYIPRIKWSNDPNKLCIYKLNRHQNHLQLFLHDSQNEKTSILLEEQNKYFIDITDDHTFLSDNKHFIWTSEKDGFNHIYLYDMEGKEVSKITSGKYDVSKFYGVDEKNKLIYFQASKKSPLYKQIFSTDFEGKKIAELSPDTGSSSAQFSSTYDYYVLTNSTFNTPPTFTVYHNKNKIIRIIEDNKGLRTIQKEYGVADHEFFSFTTSENVELNGWMIKPADFNPTRKYPVFMTQYSGPGSQSVQDQWGGANYWWYQMLAQNGYIIVCVDGRGTGGRGEEFKKMTYLQLGHYETIDQIETAKYLGKLPYVDKNRIGIYGWSYGGFMSSLCILKGNDFFKAAIAVAPVISWKWYDTIYTERYMRTLKENEAGYKENSPFYFADRLKGNYLLIHGMADDNVHFQHSVEMANALIKANKQFDTYIYPNRNHGIYGDNARIHLFTKMTNFIYEKI